MPNTPRYSGDHLANAGWLILLTPRPTEPIVSPRNRHRQRRGHLPAFTTNIRKLAGCIDPGLGIAPGADDLFREASPDLGNPAPLAPQAGFADRLPVVRGRDGSSWASSSLDRPFVQTGGAAGSRFSE